MYLIEGGAGCGGGGVAHLPRELAQPVNLHLLSVLYLKEINKNKSISGKVFTIISLSIIMEH